MMPEESQGKKVGEDNFFETNCNCWDGIGWDGMGWYGMVWDGMGWGGMGWDGMAWDGVG